MIFQAASFLVAAANEEVLEDTSNAVIVITPLNSVMINQVVSLEKREISACYLDYSCSFAFGITTDVSKRELVYPKVLFHWMMLEMGSTTYFMPIQKVCCAHQS